MRWPTFWEAFWFLMILAVPIISLVAGYALRRWFGFPALTVAVSPLLGLAGLFAVVWVLVWFDDRRRR
jgi:hypothetical protein